MARSPSAHVGGIGQRVAGGSENPLRDMVPADRARLVRLAYRFLWNHEDAEDAVQDALLIARTREGQVQTTASWWAWIRRILINRCHERGRKQQVRDRHTEASVLRPTADHGTAHAGEEIRHHLRSALRGLPRRQCEVIVLRHVEGLPYDEISQLLGISPSTARVHARAAREALREIMVLKSRIQPHDG